MSVMKEDGTRRLIQQILASLKVGKIAIMDTVLSNTSNNPVQNKVIKQAIDGTNTRIDGVEDSLFKKHHFSVGNPLIINKTECEFLLIIRTNAIYLITNFEIVFPDNEGTVTINAIAGDDWIIGYSRSGNNISLISPINTSGVYVTI